MRFRAKWTLWSGLFTLAAGACDPPEPAEDPRDEAVAEDAEEGDEPARPEVAAEKVHRVDGRNFRFQKLVDPDGRITSVVLDEYGEAIDESEVPRIHPAKIGPDLRAAITVGPGDAAFDVLVALVEAPSTEATPLEWSEALVDERGVALVTLNDVAVTAVDVAAANDSLFARIAAERAARLDRNRATLRELGSFSVELARQPGMIEAQLHGRSSVSLTLAARDVEVLLRQHDHLVAGIELADPLANHLAEAMLDTRVDPYAIGYAGRRGGGIGIYMSEETCPDPGHISNYTRLNTNPANASVAHSQNVSAIVRGVSPESYLYCRSGYTLPTAADLNGYEGHPRVYVETHSWGETTAGTDYRIRDRDFDNHVYNDLIAHFQSAGNVTASNPSCMVGTPAKALNLTAVGNYDDATDTINSSSCFIDSQIDNDKPELSAPGTSITAGGWTMSGTSMAAPHAAGFATNLMSALTWLQLRPARVKAAMLAGAAKSVSGGADKVGVGGLDFYRTYFNGQSSSCTGDNAAFASFDAGDYLPNNGAIDKSVTLDASLSSVRVALAWLNRGTYTYDHRADATPLGIDLDLCVHDPNGKLVGCSTSIDNPYELLVFDPVVTGNYRVSVTRQANRDIASKMHMAIQIDW